MRIAVILTVLGLPFGASAEGKSEIIAAIVDSHVLPGFERLAVETRALDAAAQATCDPEDADLRARFGSAFDAWIGVSHLRFGPAETDNRAFGVSFWPDTRGAIPKTLNGLIAAEDPVVRDPGAFATVSVAGRGFYALEFLLYDPAFAPGDAEGYSCELLHAVTADIARTAAAISDDWTNAHAAVILSPGPGSPYQDEDEALRALYTALTTGLEVTSDARVGRPLGTFERPRPKRAEARRSGRSLAHVVLSLEALRELGVMLASPVPEDADRLDAAFVAALDSAARLDDPVFAGVSDPQGRFRVEVLQQRIDEIRIAAGETIAPSLGISAGFNSLDGD